MKRHNSSKLSFDMNNPDILNRSESIAYANMMSAK